MLVAHVEGIFQQPRSMVCELSQFQFWIGTNAPTKDVMN